VNLTWKNGPPIPGKGKISLGLCGRFSLAELVSLTVSIVVVCIWVLTGHWALMDFLGMGLCVAFIAFVRLPSLKVRTHLTEHSWTCSAWGFPSPS
jgi:hypothetical protein